MKCLTLYDLKIPAILLADIDWWYLANMQGFDWFKFGMIKSKEERRNTYADRITIKSNNSGIKSNYRKLS